MIQLQDILSKIPYLECKGSMDFTIHSLEMDSRKVEKGSAFFAIKGTVVDGHQFISTAIEKGATVIFCEEIPEQFPDDICCIKVSNTLQTMGLVAHEFFGRPSEKIKLIGVTGTNGKTSVCTLLYQMMQGLGKPAMLLSTVENIINGTTLASTHTTPDSITINALLSQGIEAGCEYAFMEVSSHGIAQDRIAGLHFYIGGFTNITRDHLDYHGTFTDYIKAKKKFFDQLPSTSFAITNVDDVNGKIMLQNTKATKYSYALKTMADFKGKIIEVRLDGMLLECNQKEFWTSLTGTFNAYNLLLVYAIGSLCGLDDETLLIEISKLKGAKGRFEVIQSQEGIFVIVDYAHTPDALSNVLQAINGIRTKNETVFCVFGCGGNRDTGKRPEMGKVAVDGADKVIITSDNPRNENPSEIIQDIVEGIPEKDFKKYQVNIDRKEAIKQAIEQAQQHDIIVIAGKGHEDYQEIQGIKHPFDDVQVAKNLLTLLNK